jgi:hypothetical protein
VSGPLPDDVVARFVERCRAERRAAGLPEHIEDADVLDRIAAIVADSGDKTRHD